MEKILETLINQETETFNKKQRTNNFSDINDINLGKMNIKVFGIGGAGCNVVRYMATSNYFNDSVELYAFDTDISPLRKMWNASLEVNCHLLGKLSNYGKGSGGNVDNAKQIASEEVDKFKEFAKGADLIFFIGGLGKGTGSAVTPIFSRAAKEMGICTVNIVTLPSIQAEGHDVYEKSLASYQEIVESCDSFYTISNDKLINAYLDDDMTYEELLGKANNQAVNLIKVVSDILSNPSYTSIAASDILSFFKRTKVFTLLSTEINDIEYSYKTINEKISSIVSKDCSLVPLSNAKHALLNLISTPKTTKNIIVNLRSILSSYPNNTNISLSYGCMENANSDTIKMDILISSNLSKEEILNNYDHLDSSSYDTPHIGILSQVSLNDEAADFGIFAKPAQQHESSISLPTNDGIRINQFLDTTVLVHHTSHFVTTQKLTDEECTDILESVYLKSKK